jgi:hypothetical protein
MIEDNKNTTKGPYFTLSKHVLYIKIPIPYYGDGIFRDEGKYNKFVNWFLSLSSQHSLNFFRTVLS